jgi:hypothetical protein
MVRAASSHCGAIPHGGIELPHDLQGYVIDDVDAADLPAQVGHYLCQPMRIGVEPTTAQDLAAHRYEL